jgi:hypothetical protein
MDYLQECAVRLHANKDVDCDLTLDRGRLYVSNHKDKGTAVVRLRFGHEVWDLTLLEPGSEVVVELFKHYSSDINYLDGEEPLANLHFFVLKGKASLAIEYNQYPNLQAPPGPAFFTWDNKGPGHRGPLNIEKIPPLFDKVLPVNGKLVDDMNLALKELSQRMLPDKAPAVACAEVLEKDEQPGQHVLAIYCLGALDDVKRLIDMLGNTDPLRALDRDRTIFALRFWLGRDAGQALRLYDQKKHTGLLLAKQEYTSEEAETILQLLHGFPAEARFVVETYQTLGNYLVSGKVAIAELAYYHLRRFTFGVKGLNLDRFNAAFPKDARQMVADEIKQLITKGDLPPRTTGKPDTPAGPMPPMPPMPPIK